MPAPPPQYNPPPAQPQYYAPPAQQQYPGPQAYGQPQGTATPQPSGQPQKISFVWWLVPFFLSIIGGIIAYFGVRKKNPTTARNLLIFGVVWFVLEFLLATGII